MLPHIFLHGKSDIYMIYSQNFPIMSLEQMRQTIGLVGTLTEASLSPQARDDLLGAFRRWKQT